MIKKIVSLLILVSFLIFSPNIVRAQWPCTDQIPPRCSLGNDCKVGYSCKVDNNVGGCSCQANCTRNSLPCTTNTQCCSGYCGDNICSTPPPPATATPTQEPCDIDGNNICNTPDPYCLKIGCNGCLETDPYPDHYNGTKTVECWTSEACYLAGKDTCYVTDSYSDPIYCPESCGTSYVPTPPEPTCQPYACYNMGDPHCQVSFPGCPGGVGYCDNCGGTDCGLCPGSSPAVPTLPVCSPNCIDPNISPCIATTCYNTTCLGNCNQWCYGMLPATNPDTPVLSNPASGTIVNVNTSVNLDWNAISSWGTGCPQSNKYQVCVMSDSTCDLLNWVDVASTETIKTWTPTSADSLVTWKVRSNNGSNTAESLTRTLRVNAPPTFTSLVIKNANNVVAVGETGGTTLRNHICQTTFQNSTIPRRVVFEASVNDPDGAADISTATLTWNGKNYLMTKVGSPTGTGATMRATVDFSSTDNNGGVYDLFVTVTDINGVSSGSVNTNRDWKVWDCQVPTSGTLYNGSAGQACFTGLGFSVPIDAGVGFNSITFSDTPNVVMTDNDLDSYGTNNVTWGKNYLPLINGDDASNIDGTLLATGRITRIIDLGTGTTYCPSSVSIGTSNYISAYSNSPQAKIDFSFIQDQEAWYQVVGAGVKSRNRLEYGVPVTVLPVTNKFLTLGDATRINGLVSGIDFENKNGNNLKNDIGSPNNWYVLRNTNDLDIYNYNYFYNNFYVKAGVGITGTGWSGKPANGIYFVKTNLIIDNNFVLANPSENTMMVIVNGDITIQPNVTRLDGIYIADGSITAGGDNATALTINGMLYAGGNVRLYRSFTDKTDNNTTPAVKVNYSPGLIFNLPPKILRVLSGWKEE